MMGGVGLPMMQVNMGTGRLVAAMEHLDRIVGAFADDMGRSVAQIRSEINAEREMAMLEVAQTQSAVEAARQQLASDRSAFHLQVKQQQAHLESAWAELRQAQEALQADANRLHTRAAETDISTEVARQLAVHQQSLANLALVQQTGALAGLGATPTPGGAGVVGGAVGERGTSVDRTANSNAIARVGAGAEDATPGLGAKEIFAVGGLQKANTPLDSAEVWKRTVRTWEPIPSMQLNRGYLGVALSCGKVYAVGGSDGSTTLDSVEEYDPSLNLWYEVANLDTPRIWCGCATVETTVFAAGGYDGREYLGSVESLQCLGGSASEGGTRASWQPVASMITNRSTFGMCTLKEKIYAVGGFQAPSYLNKVEGYDPRANHWYTCEPLEQGPRRDLGLAALEELGCIFAIGGYDGQQCLTRVETYDPREDKWRQAAPLPEPRQLLAACAAHGWVYALGGFDGRKTCDSVFAYDVRIDKWLTHQTMGNVRLGLGAVAFL